MAETTTVNFGWTKPDPGASANTWGVTLNATTDKIDAVAWANKQAGMPIGSIVMFGGATAPANWLVCDGRSLPTTGGTYDALFAVFGYAHGGAGANFNLPNLKDVFPRGVGTNPVGKTGGSSTVTLATANLPAHAHTITEPPGGHTHGASQPAHNHGDQGHAHPDGGSYQDAHNHTFQSAIGSGSGLTNGGASYSLATITTSTAQPAVHAVIGTGYANLAAAQPAVNVNAAVTGINTTNNAGSGTAVTIPVPPYVTLNYIVRYQ